MNVSGVTLDNSYGKFERLSMISSEEEVTLGSSNLNETELKMSIAVLRVELLEISC